MITSATTSYAIWSVYTYGQGILRSTQSMEMRLNFDIRVRNSTGQPRICTTPCINGMSNSARPRGFQQVETDNMWCCTCSQFIISPQVQLNAVVVSLRLSVCEVHHWQVSCSIAVLCIHASYNVQCPACIFSICPSLLVAYCPTDVPIEPCCPGVTSGHG